MQFAQDSRHWICLQQLHPQDRRVSVAEETLARCPCGQVPAYLCVESSPPEKWTRVSGSCCCWWAVEFRSQYKDGEELMGLAKEAWNESPRCFK